MASPDLDFSKLLANGRKRRSILVEQRLHTYYTSVALKLASPIKT